eukprot:TRINITY_DN12713_c0_g1_i2.p1 TRINITY_DN12713_c0_g1~~TRINITY_DN12713_c0_g1_i2.p1  ORF type:complete len:129 (+),score=17.78 TRINITY_DN12713_c0_g1_i2:404-790(+)
MSVFGHEVFMFHGGKALVDVHKSACEDQVRMRRDLGSYKGFKCTEHGTRSPVCTASSQRCLPESSNSFMGPLSPVATYPIPIGPELSLIHISEPTRLLSISYAVFCLKKKKRKDINISEQYRNTNIDS